MSAPPVDAHTVATFVGRQRKLNDFARAWLGLPQVTRSDIPLGVARQLLRAMDDNLAQLIKALK